MTTQKQVIIGYEGILKNLKYAVVKNIPTLLIGETGVGKTSLIRHIAYDKGVGFRRLNLNGQTSIDEFVGKMLINSKGTFWQDGVLTDAMRKGYWLVLDELNAALPEILFVLHSLLDDDNYIVLSENKGEIIKPHKNFRIFATMNPSGRYAGTKELNKALLSRFPMILQIDFPTYTEEVNIVSHYSSLAKADIQHLVQMASDIRESYKKEEIEFVLSTRDLINCALIAQDLGFDEAIKLNVINRCNKEDLKPIQTIINLYFGKSVIRKEVNEIQQAETKVLESFLPVLKQMQTRRKEELKYSQESVKFLQSGAERIERLAATDELRKAHADILQARDFDLSLQNKIEMDDRVIDELITTIETKSKAVTKSRRLTKTNIDKILEMYEEKPPVYKFTSTMGAVGSAGGAMASPPHASVVVGGLSTAYDPIMVSGASPYGIMSEPPSPSIMTKKGLLAAARTLRGIKEIKATRAKKP